MAGFDKLLASLEFRLRQKEVCGALGIPPVLHMGSCVDNVRILVLASALANALNVDISDLPIAGAAPEWIRGQVYD